MWVAGPVAAFAVVEGLVGLEVQAELRLVMEHGNLMRLEAGAPPEATIAVAQDIQLRHVHHDLVIPARASEGDVRRTARTVVVHMHASYTIAQVKVFQVHIPLHATRRVVACKYIRSARLSYVESYSSSNAHTSQTAVLIAVIRPINLIYYSIQCKAPRDMLTCN